MVLFAAFLLEPALTLLFDLLFFVILVLDTTITLLSLKFFYLLLKSTYSRIKFLPRELQVVKVLLVNCLIILGPDALSSCNSDNSQSTFIDMAIGEYREISARNLSHYAVSNKELMSTRHFESKNHIMIRAKHQGLSNLKLWSKDGTLKEYNVFIHTKLHISRARMKMIRLQHLGLTSSIINSTISICGKLTTLKDVERYTKEVSAKDEKFEIDNQVEISKDLQKDIANLIYSKFIEKKITNVVCKFDRIPIKCKVPKSKNDLKSIIEYSLSSIPIEVIMADEALLLPNFKLKTRLLLLESASAEVLQLGLNKVASNVYSLLQKDFNSFIGENLISFEDKDIKLSSIASPEILTRVNHKGEISIGSEIPFTRKAKEEYITNWKFAGLKLKTYLEKENEQYFLNIETELSRPLSNGANATISANKTNSRVKLVLNESLNIFDIGHHGIQSEGSSLPYLSKVPILGRLFSSTSEIETYKNIKLFVQLEKHP